MSGEPFGNLLGNNWLRRAERAALSRIMRERLSAEEILLYDAAGTPILRGSDLWTSGQAECRRQAHVSLDHLLDRMPSTSLSPEKLVEALKDLAQTDPKYTFEMIDGKLSLPFAFIVGQVKMKGHTRSGIDGASGGQRPWATLKSVNLCVGAARNGCTMVRYRKPRWKFRLKRRSAPR